MTVIPTPGLSGGPVGGTTAGHPAELRVVGVINSYMLNDEGANSRIIVVVSIS
jgi:hypothetical protein